MVEETKEDHGLNRSLEAIDLAKSSWYYHQKHKVSLDEKYDYLKEPLVEIILQNPEYGSRRIKVELMEEYDIFHSRWLVLKMLRHWNLNMMQNARETTVSGYRKAISELDEEVNIIREMEEIDPFEVAYTDFTEITYAGGDRCAKLMPIIDHDTKIILGWSLAKKRGTNMALLALDRAFDTLEELDVDREGMIVHQDRDSVFTGDRWGDRLLREEGLRLSYSENGAKGNTYMESFNGHFKCPVKSEFAEAETMSELEEIIRKRVNYWNAERRHSAIDYQSPLAYIQEVRNNEN